MWGTEEEVARDSRAQTGLWGPLMALMKLGTGSSGFQPGQIN